LAVTRHSQVRLPAVRQESCPGNKLFNKIKMDQQTFENQPEAKPAQANLESMSRRIEEIYVSVEKTRKYFLWTLIITVAMIILPLIALAVVIPFFLQTLNSTLGI